MEQDESTFSNKKNNTNLTLLELCEGDIFYTFAGDLFQLYKLLHKEESQGVYYVLFYASFSALPSVDDIDTFEVSIYHVPMRKSSLINPVFFAKHKISPKDLIGLHAYFE